MSNCKENEREFKRGWATDDNVHNFRVQITLELRKPGRRFGLQIEQCSAMLLVPKMNA
jgi:hypothetical protein